MMKDVKRYKPVINEKPYNPYAYCEEDREGIYVSFEDYASLKAERDALAAENAALKFERKEMVAIGELIRNQDNRTTDQPFFAVMTKREIVGSEDHDCDRICWVENKSGDYVEATETQHRRLETIYQGKYKVRDGWDRFALKEIDVFVTGCFTEQGCKDYIGRNGHNLKKPFIFAFGSYRNNEYQKVRKFIMDMTETPATDAFLLNVQADGVDKLGEYYNFSTPMLVQAEAKKFAKKLRSQAEALKGGE